MVDAVKLHSTLKDVPLAKMRVSNAAQRELRQHRVNELHADFDPEMFGQPVVNFRDNVFWIIDGQHRVEAVKLYLGDGWDKQQVTCRVYSGLTEQQEADMFDRLNNQLAVRAFDKFKVRCTAKRQTETAVMKAVQRAGLKVSPARSGNSVSAVVTMVKVIERTGQDSKVLDRALKITYESFGEPGLTNQVIDGTARVCERYNGAINDEEVIDRLKSMRGGVGSLMTRATNYRHQTGRSLNQCVAASIVDVLNARRGGKKLLSWWKEQ